MKKIIITFALLLVYQFGFSQAVVDEAFKKDVLKVIEKSGSAGQIDAAKKQIIASIPEDKQAAFLLEFDVIVAKVYDGMAKAYMEAYNKEDIKAMLAFYESPVGKKMFEKAAEISEKAMATNQEINGEIQALMMKYMQ